MKLFKKKKKSFNVQYHFHDKKTGTEISGAGEKEITARIFYNMMSGNTSHFVF